MTDCNKSTENYVILEMSAYGNMIYSCKYVKPAIITAAVKTF